VFDNEAQETLTEQYLARGVKPYNNQWFYKKYHSSLKLDEPLIQAAEVRGKDITRYAVQLADGQAEHAETRLAWIINNGQVAASVPSNVDDTGGQAFFTTTHLYEATTYSNNLTVNIVSTVNTIEVNHANLLTGVNAWIAAPDTFGKVEGFSNTRDNLVIIASANLRNVLTTLLNYPAFLSSVGVLTPSMVQGIPFVIVRGLNNNTAILSRRPSEGVAGFYWGMDPWIHSASAMPDANVAVYKWTYARKWVVAPSTPQAVLRIGA